MVWRRVSVNVVSQGVEKRKFVGEVVENGEEEVEDGEKVGMRPPSRFF